MAKVLIHSLLFAPDSVSDAYLYTDLARELMKLGHEVTVLTTTPHYNVLPEVIEAQPLRPRCGTWLLESEVDGITVFHVRVPSKKPGVSTRTKTALRFHALSTWWALRGMNRHDIVISPSPPLSIGVVSWALSRIWRVPSVYLVQDVFPDGLILDGKITNKWIIRGLRTLERFVYNRNTAVVVIAESFAKVLRPRMRSPESLRLIPNFVDEQVYRPLPRDNEFTRQYGLTDRFVVSYAGNIGNGQDFTPVIEAAKQCRDLPITFVIVGDGIKKAALEAEVSNARLENVIILGYQPRSLVPYINAGSDLCAVLLDKHVQGFGFPSKIYTIMACGKPPIVWAPNGSDLATIISESNCGRFVNVGNTSTFVSAVCKAYVERFELPAEGERGRQFVTERYTKKVVAAKYDALIRELTQSGVVSERTALVNAT